MDSSRPAFVSLVPTQLRRVLADGAQAALAGFHSVLLGGDAADQRLLQRAQQSGINVVTTYGMTETCGGCVYDGVPLEGMSVTLEPDQRIVISGPSVAAGYRNDPAATARCFTAGTFRTDDQGRWDDGGRLEVRGRLDDAVMSGGFTVSPPLVEALLCEHPAVEQACVVGLPDSRWGQVVAGMVVLRSEGGPDSPGATDTTLRAVTDHVAANAERAAVPRRLVAVADLPRSSSGKIDRAAVRQALADDPGH